MIGRTIARIEESPTDPKYGDTRDDTLLIHFTDGTALRVEGHSHEDVSLSFEIESPRELCARRNAAVGRREKARLRRLQREEWLSITCDERAERKARYEARLSAEGRGLRNIVSAEMHDALLDMYVSSNRMLWGDAERVVRLRCKNCGDRQCPNAPTKTLPAEPYKPAFWQSTVTIPVKPKLN